MAIYAMIGIFVVNLFTNVHLRKLVYIFAAIFAAGAAWVVRNVSFKPINPQYDYKTDEHGNESVKDNSNERT